MRVSIVGSGYVGTTISACFADLGHEVVNIDVDEDVVTTINSANSPLHEVGLSNLIAEHAGEESTGRLEATTDYDAVRDTDVTFLCLPTPQAEDGSIDLSILKTGAEQTGETLVGKDDWHTVIVKSTVIPGSTENVITPVLEDKSGKTAGEEFGTGMNPEFLREGTAVQDFLNPDKIVLGADDERTLANMHDVFDPLIDAGDAPVVKTDTRTAEMVKYANNAFLAAKISLINDIGNICKEFGINTYKVADAIGLDDRISEQFLRSGLGWGGSCLPKDTNAIIHAARQAGYDPAVLEAALEVNERQPERLLSLLDNHVDVAGERVAVLGLAFKPGTDDVRNSRAIPVIRGLRERGAEVVAYDPVAIDKMREHFPHLEYASLAKESLEEAIACVICTDWDEFKALDDEFETMNRQVVIDGRRIVIPRDDMVYEGLTW